MAKTLFYRWFGVGRVPETWRARLEPEGILCLEEGVPLTTTLRAFKSPWRLVRLKKSRCSGSLVVTSQRLVGFGRSRSAIHIPCSHPAFHKLRIHVEAPDVLLIEYQSEHFIPETSGTVELRFQVEDPGAFVTAIESARADVRSG